MLKYVLLRGHEGSGKSTFAAQYAQQFQSIYPHAHIECLDNDVALYDENGHYHFDFTKFQAAHQHNMQRQNAVWAMGLTEPQHDILLINANTNQKTKTCHQFIQQAQFHGFEVEVYRLHPFFPNVHGMTPTEIWQSYARLNANPVANEIHIHATVAQCASCQVWDWQVFFQAA